MERLADELEVGGQESPTLHRRLSQYEQEEGTLGARIEEARAAHEAALALPDDGWIRARLGALPSLWAAEPDQAVPLLRRLLGAVTAEAVVAPGKKRGFIRLRFRIEGRRVL